jgi:hypothetical protein
MTTEALPGKGGNAMNFTARHADDLWGRSRKDPQWREAGGGCLENGRGNKLKLKDGKWVSA